jgi:ligand-binding sensor domain-containing protein
MGGQAGNWITAIASDGFRNMWFGTESQGMSKFNGTNWTTYTKEDGLADNSMIPGTI